MARICCICGEKIGLIGGVMIKNREYLCPKCVKAAGHNPVTWTANLRTSKSEVLHEIQELSNPSKPSIQELTVTHSVGNIFMVDETNQLWYTQDMFSLHRSSTHSFSEILDFELLEDGNSITKGGMGNALLGGLTFGAVGAIVGSNTGKKTTKTNCTSLRIKVTLNNMNNPVEYINLLQMKVSRSSAAYKKAYEQAQQILSMLQIMSQKNKENI